MKHDLTNRLPAKCEVQNARDAATALADVVDVDGAIKIGTRDDQSIELTPVLTRLVLDLLCTVARGRVVVVDQLAAQIPLARAAALLNVRPAGIFPDS